MPYFKKMLMVRRSTRASTVRHNDRNRIPSPRSWSGCSRKILASKVASNRRSPRYAGPSENGA